MKEIIKEGGRVWKGKEKRGEEGRGGEGREGGRGKEGRGEKRRGEERRREERNRVRRDYIMLLFQQSCLLCPHEHILSPRGALKSNYPPLSPSVHSDDELTKY